MKDKLTKKRIKIDYLLVVMALSLSSEFLVYQKNSRIRSVNRQARYFLQQKKIDYKVIYQDYFNRGIITADQLFNEFIRIAQDHSCWEVDD